MVRGVSLLRSSGTSVACALGLAVFFACSEKPTTFAVSYAPGYTPGPLHASILGVYREGRLDVDGLRPLGAELTQSAFHADVCPVAVDAELRAQKPGIFDAIDEATKTEGVTEPLLAALAPAAEGDSIVFITMSGQARVVPDGGAPSRSASSSPSVGVGGRGGGRRGGGMSRGGGGRSAPARTAPEDDNALSLTATVYSVRDKRVVAAVAETYTGTSEATALREFRDKLAATFPGASCTGWKADAWPTEDTLRHLPEE